jgi:hypothetical protein
VSEIAPGTWRFGRETAAGSLETARDLLSAYEAAGSLFTPQRSITAVTASATVLCDI